MENLFQSVSSNQVVSSISLILILIALRFLVEVWIARHKSMENETRKRIRANIRNSLILLGLVAMVFIWAPALRTFALSLTAFAVATIIATKELILCLSGYLLKTSRGLARIGDWIEINSVRGEIVDQDFLTTVVEELGTGAGRYEFTGRTLVIPNSQFLSATVKNDRFNKRYTYHNFRITVKSEVDTSTFRNRLLENLKEQVAPYSDVALRYKSVIEKRAGIKLNDNLAQMNCSFRDDGSISLDFVCFVPVEKAVEIENVIKFQASDEIAAFFAQKNKKAGVL